MSAPDAPTRPVVRLRPKAEARAIRHGFPWVYADELSDVGARRGSPTVRWPLLEDAERRPLGLVTVNNPLQSQRPDARRDPEAEIDRAWFARLSVGPRRALRARYLDAPFYRLVMPRPTACRASSSTRFGRGRGSRPNAAWARRISDALVAARSSR